MGRRRVHRTIADARRFSRYRLTGERFEQMRASQRNRCLICGAPVRLVVDHSHSTKKVRGLLCRRCNMGLGYFGDDAKVLRRAAAYITVFGCAHPDPYQLILNLQTIGGY